MRKVFSIPAVNAVIANTPTKVVREVPQALLDARLAATEDRNGRFHAPHNEFECPLTGGVYNAGEFLPYSDPADTLETGWGRDASWRYVEEAICALSGNKVVFRGTPSQIKNVRDELARQQRVQDALQSTYVGNVKDRMTKVLSGRTVFSYETEYGPAFIGLLRDEDGNVYIYRGGRKVESYGPYADEFNGAMTFSVKSHGERDGVKQTLIARPAIKK
jgi:hypothetical protein